ncbi:MAG: SLBB domain-containing protein [Endomicrobia bacterium]|nr:SLBB domain-containing protein [Endomicrobiia bacterium]
MNLIEKIRQAGIVGAGGAGFPTYFKISSAAGKVDTYIINAAECEPLIQVDKQILKCYPEQILTAAVDVANFLGAKKVVVGIKHKYKETVEVLERIIQKFDHKVEIFYLDNFYPAGDEFSLVYEITGRIIPEGGLPLEVGVVVSNVVSLLNIYNTLYEGYPVISRPISVIGEVVKPKTIVVPVGTIVKDVLTLCGGTKIKNFVVIDGGPMMGKIVSIDDVVTKRTSSLLILPVDHPVIRMKTLSEHYFLYQIKSACEQCRDCTEICPRYLLGHNFECHRIQRSVSYNVDDGLLTQAYLCCECGLCDWVCPMNLLPRRVNQTVKQKLAQRGIKNPHRRKPERVRVTKEYRKLPPERIIARFQLNEYVNPAPIELDTKEVNFVKIPLLQHIGTKAIPKVKVGDTVEKYQELASVEADKLGVGIHAPFRAKVVEVTENYISLQQ